MMAESGPACSNMAESGPGGSGSRYRAAFNPDTWEQELEAIPMFMKQCPAEIEPCRQPELACLQSLLFDEEQSPAELARMYKNEGNEYFKERDYKRAVIAYTEGLKKCEEPELSAVLHTNRGAAQFHLGNYRSALNDATQAKKLKPTHLKAIVRGALCHLELKNFSEAIAWCEEGLQIDSKEKKLVEIRAKADRLKRAEERDARKAKVMERKKQCQKEILLAAIKERNIKLVLEPSLNEEEEISDGLAEISLDGFHSENATGAKVHLDAEGSLNWPVLFLYPEHGQTDFIAAFHENSRFIDHLMVMFAELPPWDLERKYLPSNLELYFEDEERAEMYELNPEHTLLQVLQHQRYFVKAGTPTVLAFVKQSAFSKKYFLGKKVHRL
ncbi:tetratricopeptide repeat protein 4 isoform 2-T4 [Phaethornis superciliosus]